MRHHAYPKAQQGMAVISVLMLVALIAILASTLVARQSAAIRQAELEQNHQHIYWQLRAEISRAKAQLGSITRQKPVVRLNDAWNQGRYGQAIALPNGQNAFLYSEVADEQAKFNLRNLVDKGHINLREFQAFERLCALVGVAQPQSQLIAKRVIVSLLQAEGRADPSLSKEEKKALQQKAAQIGLDPSAEHDLAPRIRDITELAGEPGVQAATLQRLSPYITFLPERTWINANTAPPEVIAAWVPGLSLDQAKTLLASRDRGQWFTSHGDFTTRLQRPDLPAHDILIGVTSLWFRLHSVIQSPRHTNQIQALLQLDENAGQPTVVWLREGV